MVIKRLKERIKSLSGNMDKDKIKQDLEEIETINIELDHRVTKLIAENEHWKQTNKDMMCLSSRKVLVITTPQDDIKELKGNRYLANNASYTSSSEELAVLRDLVDHIKRTTTQIQPLESACVKTQSTSASESQPSGNFKKDNDSAKQSSTQMKKVGSPPVGKVKSSLNNIDHVVVIGCMLLIIMICVFFIISICVVVSKSKSSKNKQEKSLGKQQKEVYTDLLVLLETTGRTFTIVGNAFPLTRITTTTEAPLRKPIVLDNKTSKPAITLVYSRKPGNSKTNVPVSKSKVLQSISATKREPVNLMDHIVFALSSPKLLVNKFLGTVKFKNDHVAKILGYGDYQIRNVTISRVYYVEGLGHNFVFVGQFFDSNLEWCVRRSVNGKGSTSSSCRCITHDSHGYSLRLASPQQNGVVERRNRTLIEAARTMLIYAKASLFLWAKAVATACYTQNRSIIRLRRGKTPYELLHDKLLDLSFFHVFEAFRIYKSNRTENPLKIIHVDFDELNAMDSEHRSSGPALYEMTPATISSGLVPNPPPLTPFVPPSRTNWDMLFQSLFDELLNPPPSVDPSALEVVAPIDEVWSSTANGCERRRVLNETFLKFSGSHCSTQRRQDADHAGCQDTRRSTSGSISKHIDIRFHFIKEHVENGVIELCFVNTEYRLADIFTKAIAEIRLNFRDQLRLGMRSFTPETLTQLADEVDE
ncbi:retrovirus-related pol polyprotein from transposon TNT 1-94 [Tanacetum coccineum]|uniref:Retrovirus-related pol polyprotein from transposon TNT 1-94 n=1 Tax=Tanacetum coccineum TaxID=301880 RepID=A0ABQ4YVR3_9ASTR